MTKRQILLWGLMLILLSGCGRANRGTVPVSVEIWYNGKPVAEASVQILNSEGKYAVGVTDNKGVARLFTFEPNDGAMPGRYRVAADKHETVFPDAPKSAAEDTGKIAGEPKHTWHIPQKYTDVNTSELSLEVVKGRKNHFVFQLNDK
jgi:hypothetical protein